MSKCGRLYSRGAMAFAQKQLAELPVVDGGNASK